MTDAERLAKLEDRATTLEAEVARMQSLLYGLHNVLLAQAEAFRQEVVEDDVDEDDNEDDDNETGDCASGEDADEDEE